MIKLFLTTPMRTASRTYKKDCRMKNHPQLMLILHTTVPGFSLCIGKACLLLSDSPSDYDNAADHKREHEGSETVQQ